jgi:hypothetical protein
MLLLVKPIFKFVEVNLLSTCVHSIKENPPVLYLELLKDMSNFVW